MIDPRTIRRGERFVLEYAYDSPGEVIAEPQEGWVTLRFTVDQNVKIDELREWCPTCRNRLGHWECAELGRFCHRCQCDAEHTWLPCLLCEAGRLEAS